MQKPQKDTNYDFTSYCDYAYAKIEERQLEIKLAGNKGIKKVSQHRGKRQIDYLPRRNKLRSVEIDISAIRIPPIRALD